MSSHEGMNATDAGNDLWRVLLSSGEVRPMSLDALDAAFQDGVVTELTPLLPPKATVWTRLGIAAGLDAPDRESPDATRIMPNAVVPVAPKFESPDTTRIMPMTVNVAAPVVTAGAPARGLSEWTMGRALVAIGITLMVLVGLSRAARSATFHSATTSSFSAAEAPGAPDTLGAGERSAVPPAASLNEVVAAQTDAQSLTPKMKQKRMGADRAHDARDAQKGTDRAVPPARHGRRAKSGSTPFLNGGDRFDPLNGAL